MLTARWRPIVFTLLTVLVIWVAAVVGYTISKNAIVTADKVRVYVETVDLSKLSGADRAKALKKLADMLNALSAEERREARMEHVTWNWFNQMTEAEKADFLEATMPTGFKQMLTAFEQLPEEKRHRTIDETLRRMRETQQRLGTNAVPSGTNTLASGTNRAPVLSPELEAKVRSIGLQTFYSQSSPQTRAELAPVLEEMQHVMESGRPFRTRGGP